MKRSSAKWAKSLLRERMRRDGATNFNHQAYWEIWLRVVVESLNYQNAWAGEKNEQQQQHEKNRIGSAR